MVRSSRGGVWAQPQLTDASSFLSFVPVSSCSIIHSTSAARQSRNFRQMVNDTNRFYRTKIPYQTFRNVFINGKQPGSVWHFPEKMSQKIVMRQTHDFF